MKAMLMSKLKTIAVLLVVCAVGGVGWVATVGEAGKEPDDKVVKNAVGIQFQKDKTEDKKPEPKEKEPELVIIEKEEDRPNVPFMEATSRNLIAGLQEMVDMKDFQQEMTLGDCLGLLTDKMEGKRKVFPILVDAKAFECPDKVNFNIYQTLIKFPRFPKVMSMAKALQIAINQIPDQKAQILIRENMIVITTQERASLSYLLKENVCANYEFRPLDEVVQNLSDLTGVSINFDPKVENVTRKPISVTFRNEVTLGGALRIVTEIAGLKMVDMESSLYITTPERGKELENELRNVKK